MAAIAENAPPRICVMRLSAIGDVCHALPVVRTLQQSWPEARITWVIGKTEYGLIGDIRDIEFVVFDKTRGVRAFFDVQRSLRRRFDALLQMQTSLRANLASLWIPAELRLGYDAARSRELHGCVINRRIAARDGQHAIDAMFGFAEALGIRQRVLRWDIPVPEESREFCRRHLAYDRPILAINPCSSPSKRVWRDWHVQGYANVADYAVERYGMQVVLCGAPNERERAAGAAIAAAAKHPLVDLIGKTTLKNLAAVLDYAAVLLTSDSGPAHIATAMGTPVLGLYAATNPLQTGPYLSQEWVVNRYPEAVAAEYGKPVAELPWGTRVHEPAAMARITSAEVIAKLDALMTSTDGHVRRTH